MRTTKNVTRTIRSGEICGDARIEVRVTVPFAGVLSLTKIISATELLYNGLQTPNEIVSKEIYQMLEDCRKETKGLDGN